jgi:hypothetical protein
MKIAVIVFGSLVADPGKLKAQAAFAPTGPLLPIEFCRISTSGPAKDFLTLVIDQDDGTLCKTYAAPSVVQTLDEAIETLREREGTGANDIGFVDLKSGHRCEQAVERHPEAVETIAAWTEAMGYDAAIWTALENNFAEFGEPFSVTAALAYLEKLKERDAARFAGALAYIRAAPGEVDTAVRNGVARRWPD